MVNLPFAYEEELCAVLDRFIEGLFRPSATHHHSHTLRQRPVGQVIPDFIYISVDRAVDQPLRRGLTALDASLIAALLPGRPLRVETIARRLFTRADRIAPRLLALQRSGVVTSGESGTFSLNSDLDLDSVHVVAVEAKLHRWRDAVEQASSYLAFANQSYVALPSTVVDRNSELASAAKRARIGVIAVDDCCATMVSKAPVAAASSADWIWLLSRTIGLSALTSTSTSPQ